MLRKSTSSHGLALLTAGAALHQAISAARVLTLPPELAARLTLPLPLEFVAGVVWALVFAYLTLKLLRLHARRTAGWALIIFVTYSLLRLFLFAQADYDQQRLPFLVIVTAILLAGWAIVRRITDGDYLE
jgi:uncharacterized membrane protein YhaH (DUF805 family)